LGIRRTQPMRLLQPSPVVSTTFYAVVSYLCFFVVIIADAMAVKRILVTGGNKGIGKAICQRLVTEWSDTVVYLGSRDAERGNAAIQDILKECSPACSKDRLQLVVVDTASDASVKEAAAQMEGTELYGIINNAGVSTTNYGLLRTSSQPVTNRAARRSYGFVRCFYRLMMGGPSSDHKTREKSISYILLTNYCPLYHSI